MAKDPAFLFYASDFLTGIQDLTMEERGQYITLLCIHHQKGRLSDKLIKLSVGNATADVLHKFSKDDEGLYFNIRLEAEIEKRKQHSEKQRDRALEGWKKRKDNQSHGNATAMPLENENRNILPKELSIEQFFADFPNSSDCEAISMQLSKPKAEVIDYLKQFRLSCSPSYPTFKDFTRHFKNSFSKWLKTNNNNKIPKRPQLL
jgi:uncharacterized protein YdaU (DUF1376 family)